MQNGQLKTRPSDIKDKVYAYIKISTNFTETVRRKLL